MVLLTRAASGDEEEDGDREHGIFARTRAGRLVQEGLGEAREALLPVGHAEPPRPGDTAV